MIMKIYAICASEETDCLETIESYFESKEIELVTNFNQIGSHNDCVVVSHSTIPRLKEFNLSNFTNLYLYHSKNIVLANDEKSLLDLLEDAIKHENWKRAKGINDLLIDINFIYRKTLLSSMPDYLQIETTSFCNAKCIMCSHYFSDNKGAAHLGDSTIEHMEDALQLSRTISLNGMGEPFISDRLPNQIDYYASMGNKIVTNTNLSVLDEGLINRINKHFEWIEVSCDGATKETYESIRKNLSFDTFLKNLFVLKERCPHVRKHIATVVMRQNVHEMPDLVKLACDAGASIITFMTLNSNIVIQNQKDEMRFFPKVLEYYSVKAVEMGEKCGIPVIVPNMGMLDRSISYEEIEDELHLMKQTPFFKDDSELENMKRIASVVSTYLESHDEIQRDTKASDVRCCGVCDWLLKNSYIDLNGNVAMCCRNQSFHTGNVNEAGSFSAVWNSSFYQKLREIFYSGFVPEACLKCGLIESGNLKFLNVNIDRTFYIDPEYKTRQKDTLKALLEESDNQ